MKEECGVTQISLENAKELIDEHGRPALVVLSGNAQKGDYITTAYWGLKKIKHEFTGFAWGYAGSGPNGLLNFLNLLCKKNISKSEIAMIVKVPYVIEI